LSLNLWNLNFRISGQYWQSPFFSISQTTKANYVNPQKKNNNVIMLKYSRLFLSGAIMFSQYPLQFFDLSSSFKPSIPIADATVNPLFGFLNELFRF
jgi:hypothetical protein